MNPMRVPITDCPLTPPVERPPAHACAESLDAEADELALELHECIVWSSGISFSHQLPDAFISTAATC